MFFYPFIVELMADQQGTQAGATPPGSEKFKMLKTLLAEMFQLHRGDLDFGLYRIMNMKAAEVSDFLDNQLLPQAKQALDSLTDAELSTIRHQLEATITNLKESGLDEAAIDDVPKVVELRASLAAAVADAGTEAHVYNHLYQFFSRYYDKGDFMSLRRIRGDGQASYLIPYDGEEVKLHWANADQYYIKTTENYASYIFTCEGWPDGVRVRFEIAAADAEKDNIKPSEDKARFFILTTQEDTEQIEADGTDLVIRFDHRPLTDTENTGLQKNRKQDQLNAQTAAAINDQLATKGPADWSQRLAVPAPTAENDSRTVLEKHLAAYTAKNSFDYFIHKDLGGFLRRELGFYLKTDVLFLDDLVDEGRLRRSLAMMRAVRMLAEKIIDFLAQLEGFQKALWLKKKAVLDTHYCFTLHKIPVGARDALYPLIAQNIAQRAEWRDLYSADSLDGWSEDGTLSRNFLDSNPHLVVDTAHFDKGFIDGLLAAWSEGEGGIDGQLDGLLVHGENFQALNLLQTRYRGQVQCIYIDPPFNTGKDFFYKDSLQNSSWLTLLNERLEASKNFLSSSGSFFLHLDENANHLGKLISRNVFSNFSSKDIIFNTNATKDTDADLYGYKSFGAGFALRHQTIFNFRRETGSGRKLFKPNRNNTNLQIGWLDLIGEPLVANPNALKDFRFSVENWVNGNIRTVEINIPDGEKIFPVSDIWLDIFSFTQSEMRVSESLSFSASQKPENLLRRVIQQSTVPGQLVFDFFSGIGTTAAVAQKLSRKWIAVEIGSQIDNHYFDGTQIKLGILGRLKNVLMGDQRYFAVDKQRRPHLAKDINWQGGGAFKYIRLESYEDTLDSLDYTPPAPAATQLFAGNPALAEDYALRYQLDQELSARATLVTHGFSRPFSASLSVVREGVRRTVPVDMAETFNWLIGLTLHGQRRIDNVLAITGIDGNGVRCLILWRDVGQEEGQMEEEDALNKWFTAHGEAIRADFEATRIYVNGDHQLNRLQPDDRSWTAETLNPIFIDKMFTEG